MPLQSGTRLGPYEIQSALGAGGMGEVYRARDTRLDRTVAVKILPETLAGDRQFRERFDREARAISQLDHPHICALYDVGEEQGTAYLVMQYLEGEALAARLERGALPVAEALTIAIQIAGALDAAHRSGIVHRDLKPGNVILTKSGAKLLDFGLAKAQAIVGAGFSRPGASMLPTTLPDLTAQGTILGTFQYMAPEQLEGKDADPRTDIFAFGAVLYEMLTGRKAFEGKSHASLIGAIMHADPALISTIQPLTPPALDRIARKCLAKDPDARWQSARDLHDELQWIADGGSQTAGDPHAASSTRGTALRRRERIAWATAAVLLTMIGGVAAAWLRSVPPPSQMRLDIATPPTTDPASIAISPDGQKLIFVATSGGRPALWLRSLDSDSAAVVKGTEGASFPFWSPDNRQVAFFADNKLKRIDLQSGTSQALANANGWFCAGTWSGDDVVLYSPVPGRPILRVAPDGGPTTRATRIEDAQTTGGHCEPHFLPDGRHFFYTVLVGEGRGIYLARLDGAEARRVIQDARSPVYVPGYLLFVREAAGLFAQPFDTDRLELSGAPVQITDRVALGSSGITAAAVSASGNGTIVYRRATGTRQNQLVWFDRSGRRIGVGGEQDAVLSMPSMSSNGRTVALMRVVSGNVDVWILELARGVMNRFTSDPGNDVFPVWSPDGTRIVFSSTRVKGGHDLYVKTVGGGAEEPLLATTEDEYPTDWSPDGRYILYFTYDPKTQHNIWALPMDGSRTPLPIVQSEFEERSGQFSPDGKWVAYQSNESGRFETYVQPFPGPGPKVRVSTDGGVQVRWRNDGRELFYIALDRRLMAAPVRLSADGRTLQADTPVPLFLTSMGRPAEHLDGQAYVVSPDGQRFLISTAADDATEPITMLLNWHPSS